MNVLTLKVGVKKVEGDGGLLYVCPPYQCRLTGEDDRVVNAETNTMLTLCISTPQLKGSVWHQCWL